jgi:hypothetical protein
VDDLPPWRRVLHASGWVVAYLIGGLALTTGLLYVASRALGPAVLAADETLFLALQGGLNLVAFAGMTWLVGRRALRLGWDEIGLRDGRGARGFGLGLLGAAAMAALAIAAALPLAGARWLPDDGTATEYAAQVAGVAALLAPAALAEELMFRGVPLVVLASAIGRGGALVVLALAFGLLHAGNPGVTSLALGNIALAGVFLSLAFYAPGRLWTAWGAHLGWNVTIAALDAPVSGLPMAIPFIDYDPGAPAWLSGGAFGPEGGVLATATLLAGCLYLGRAARKDDVA